MNDHFETSPILLCKLGSIVVHGDELCRGDDEVWGGLRSKTAMAMVPVSAVDANRRWR